MTTQMTLMEMILDHGYDYPQVQQYRLEIVFKILQLLRDFHDPMDQDLFFTLMDSQYYQAHSFEDIKLTMWHMIYARMLFHSNSASKISANAHPLLVFHGIDALRATISGQGTITSGVAMWLPALGTVTPPAPIRISPNIRFQGGDWNLV